MLRILPAACQRPAQAELGRVAVNGEVIELACPLVVCVNLEDKRLQILRKGTVGIFLLI